ncbi:MAG: aminotransferase class V-fold PLP-dependent enzyme [Ruminococcaceae bacterium]|nr:aminotransferase class V-fold PLP-dependent enzyme [Oscillospiraceae bacterium]
MLYLDHAATSYQKSPAFYRAMDYYTRTHSVNAGRGGHSFSISGALGIAKTRESLARLFNISNPDRIAFCQNASMALNLAIGGILSDTTHAIVTQMEHNSVLRPVHRFGNYTMVSADKKGFVSADNVARSIRPDTRLIICTHASNVCGSIQPIKEIGKIAKQYGIPLLLDAAQTAGAYPIDVKALGVDMLAFSAHKGLLGPLGVGGLYVSESVTLKPVLSGGTGTQSDRLFQPVEMPELLEVGTQNTPAIMALKASVDYILARTPQAIHEYELSLAMHLIENLNNIPGITVYGMTEKKNRNATVLCNLAGMDSGGLADRLNDFNIATRAGWHCAYPAHCALGTEQSGGVRISFGAFSKTSDVAKVTDAIYRIAKQHR